MHPVTTSSCTLLISNMFSTYALEQAARDYDSDLSLEFDDRETLVKFYEFYEDVVPEFRRFGRVVQLKVCCNQEMHLRGNVYVQYKTEEEAGTARQALNGRYYAGKQLNVYFISVPSWRSAICGTFKNKRCPKGLSCNFIHAFPNPRGEFREADRDWSPSRNYTESKRSPDSRRSRRYRKESPRLVKKNHRDRSPESTRRSHRDRSSESTRRNHRDRSPESTRRSHRDRSPESMRRSHRNRSQESTRRSQRDRSPESARRNERSNHSRTLSKQRSPERRRSRQWESSDSEDTDKDNRWSVSPPRRKGSPRSGGKESSSSKLKKEKDRQKRSSSRERTRSRRKSQTPPRKRRRSRSPQVRKKDKT